MIFRKYNNANINEGYIFKGWYTGNEWVWVPVNSTVGNADYYGEEESEEIEKNFKGGKINLAFLRGGRMKRCKERICEVKKWYFFICKGVVFF